MTVSQLILQVDDALNLGIAPRMAGSSLPPSQFMRQDSCCKTLLACCGFAQGELSPEPDAALTFESELVFCKPRYTRRIFFYAVVAEYFRIVGDYAQSASWADKLSQALASADLSRRASIPSRRWLS